LWPASSLIDAGDRLLAFDGTRVRAFDVATGEVLRETSLGTAPSDVDAGGGVVVIADESGVSRLTPAGEIAWSVKVHLFPSPEPSERTETASSP